MKDINISDNSHFKRLIIALLQSSKNLSSISLYQLNQATKISYENLFSLITDLSAISIIPKMTNEKIMLNKSSSIKLALLAVKNGSDIEYVSRFLDWKNFELFIGETLYAEDFHVMHNFYLKGRKRYQIDLIGIHNFLILAIDCKHWKYGHGRTRLNISSQIQFERAQSLAAFLEKNNVIENFNLRPGDYYLVPVIVCLSNNSSKFHNGIPIVPVLQFQDFLRQIPSLPMIKSLKHISFQINTAQKNIKTT